MEEQRSRWWRWIGLIVIVAMLANAQVVPWPILALLLVGGGGYLLVSGWRVWSQGPGPTPPPAVKYWRGQRVELPREEQRGRGKLPPLRAIAPALVYFLLGGALVAAGAALVLRQVTETSGV
ncbi:MAG: hypothetical protein HC884_16040 [Chloroflexaceae bacterium]|nr:hypothetical protein [Chloroflexaceae bacterium]